MDHYVFTEPTKSDDVQFVAVGRTALYICKGVLIGVRDCIAPWNGKYVKLPVTVDVGWTAKPWEVTEEHIKAVTDDADDVFPPSEEATYEEVQAYAEALIGRPENNQPKSA
jgi:hypothetical protein